MRILSLFLIILCLTGAAPPKEQSKESEIGKWDGFRGIKWGTDLTTIKEMIKIGTEDFTGYIREDDSKTIGAASVDAITYVTYDNKLGAVAIEASGKVNFSALKDAFTERFGEPKKPNEFLEEYVWIGGSSGKMVIIRLTLNMFTQKTLAGILYKPMIDEQESKSKEKAKAGAEKDF